MPNSILDIVKVTVSIFATIVRSEPPTNREVLICVSTPTSVEGHRSDFFLPFV